MIKLLILSGSDSHLRSTVGTLDLSRKLNLISFMQELTRKYVYSVRVFKIWNLILKLLMQNVCVTDFTVVYTINLKTVSKKGQFTSYNNTDPPECV